MWMNPYVIKLPLQPESAEISIDGLKCFDAELFTDQKARAELVALTFATAPVRGVPLLLPDKFGTFPLPISPNFL
jgi:hypothetical protein